MSDRWYREKKREGYYRRAKQEGYRARSAFKLKQIQDKFRVIRKGNLVVDLGASPGGWSQVALELVGDQGLVVGVDLEHVHPLEGALFVRGDFTDEATREALVAKIRDARGREAVDAVISDMSPNLSGNYSMDQAESAYLANLALDFAQRFLEPGGNFVAKIFEGQDYQEFVERLKDSFDFVKPFRPEATRKQSSEVYLVAKGRKGTAPTPDPPDSSTT